MRILCIIGESDLTEINLVLELSKKNEHIEIICEPNDPSRDYFAAAGLTLHPYQVKRRIDLHAQRLIRRIAKTQKIDLIYSTTNSGLTNAIFAVLGLPTKIVAYRGTIGHLGLGNPEAWIAHRNPRITKIAANCEAVRQYLMDIGISKKKVCTVYKGHSPLWYNAQNPVSRAEFRISEDAFVLGLFANIRPLKGLDILLDALALLVKEHKCIKLLVVGEIRQNGIIEYAAKQNLTEHVHFLGFRNDAHAIMQMCNLSVMPSLRREGVARAVVEALSLGVPGIVSDVGGLPEVIQEGISGYVVPAGNPEALSVAIEKVLLAKDRGKSLGIAGAKFVNSELHYEKSAESMQKLFQAAVDGK